MIITTTDHVSGASFKEYYGIITVYQEEGQEDIVRFALENLEAKAVSRMRKLMEEDYFWEDNFALVGVRIESAPTFSKDDYGNVMPHIIAYGTLVYCE